MNIQGQGHFWALAQSHLHIKIKLAFLRNHWVILNKFCKYGFRYKEMKINIVDSAECQVNQQANVKTARFFYNKNDVISTEIHNSYCYKLKLPTRYHNFII